MSPNLRHQRHGAMAQHPADDIHFDLEQTMFRELSILQHDR
jgi:hypothetical protein